jgi:molecular chaperone HtpG
LRWKSDGGKTYSLQPIEKRKIGTTVTLHISENYRDMLMRNKLQEAIRKYADFLPIGIYLNDDEDKTNAINAPWHKHYSDAEEELRDVQNFVFKRFNDVALTVIPVQIREPYLVYGVLYISENRTLDTGMIDIYQSRMFVMQANRDILPAWAKFVRGVIDSPDLTLTASRDTVQPDEVLERVREQLGEVIIQRLIQLAQDDANKFEQICEWHHTHFKCLAARDKTFFYHIADLIPFETNQGSMNLQTYFARVKEKNQSELLYFDESGFATQFHMLGDAQGLLVINASNPFEDEFLERYGKLHPEVTLRQLNIGESPNIFKSPNSEERQKCQLLERVFREILPKRSSVKAVRFKPDSIPALTVLSEEARRRRKLEQTANDVLTPEEIRQPLLEMLKSQGPIPFTLYLNIDKSIIQKLAVSPTEETQVAYQAIFANAAMLAGQMSNPKNAELAFKDFSRLIDRMLMLLETVQAQNEQMNDQQEYVNSDLAAFSISPVRQELESNLKAIFCCDISTSANQFE